MTSRSAPPSVPPPPSFNASRQSSNASNISNQKDDDSDNEMSAKAKKSKTKKPAKTVAERRLMNELAKKAKNISHDYELFEKEFLAFLKQNTEDNKLPSKMIMNFKKGENIFRIIKPLKY